MKDAHQVSLGFVNVFCSEDGMSWIKPIAAPI